ncbi:MAG: YIP1 family protein [Acidobacteriia bacterium]|nr:YIP1 family protein [Terriglobia bacterium]
MKKNTLSFLQQCRLLTGLVWSPARTLSEIRLTTPYLCPLLLFSLAGVIVACINNSMILSFTQRTLSLSLDESQVDQTLHFIGRLQLFGVILSPAFLLMKWAIVAGLIYLAAQLMTSNMTYRQSFSLVAFTSIFQVLESCMILTILRLKRTENLNSPLDFQPPVGLNIFFDVTSLSWNTLLNDFNPFAIWYMVILILGVATLSQCSRLKAALVVVPVWLFLVCIQVAVVAISTGNQSY